MNVKNILNEVNDQHYNFPKTIVDNLIIDINENDEMFEKGKERHYYSVGFSCLDILRKVLNFLDVEKLSVRKILNFPSGYGREMRFMKSYFTESEIVASEIEQKKLDFIKEKFNTDTFLSNKEFRNLPTDVKYDLIWSGSLFTHLSARKFRKLLRYFIGILNSNGILIFTTHGRYSYSIVNTYGLWTFQQLYLKLKYLVFGFGYTSYLRSFGYGVSLSKPSWVTKQIEKYNDVTLVGIQERKWDNHQDIVVIQKKAIH